MFLCGSMICGHADQNCSHPVRHTLLLARLILTHAARPHPGRDSVLPAGCSLAGQSVCYRPNAPEVRLAEGDGHSVGRSCGDAGKVPSREPAFWTVLLNVGDYQVWSETL